MQAYEHIMTTLIKLSTDLTLEENLSFIRKYGVYLTYPDSIRALVKLSTKGAFRHPSHMSEDAWMKYIIGNELTHAKKSYPLDKIYIPKNLELKAADKQNKFIKTKK